MPVIQSYNVRCHYSLNNKVCGSNKLIFHVLSTEVSMCWLVPFPPFRRNAETKGDM